MSFIDQLKKGDKIDIGPMIAEIIAVHDEQFEIKIKDIGWMDVIIGE